MSGRLLALIIVLAGLVLLPFVLWDANVMEFSQSLMQPTRHQLALAVLVIILLALDIVLPVPSSLVSVAAGAYLGVFYGALLCLLGMTLACIVGYLLGYYLGTGRVVRIISAEDRDKASEFFSRFGAATLVLARPVPVLAEVTVVMAGLSGLSLRQLILWTLPANLGIAIAYAAVGQYALQMNSFLLAFLGAILLPAAAYAVIRLLSRNQRLPSGPRRFKS